MRDHVTWMNIFFLVVSGLTGIILNLSGEGVLKTNSRLYGSVGWVK